MKKHLTPCESPLVKIRFTSVTVSEALIRAFNANAFLFNKKSIDIFLQLEKTPVVPYEKSIPLD